MGHGQRAAACHAARHRHHVLLRDAALHESLRIFRNELEQPAVLDQVRIEHHQVRMAPRLFDERLPVGRNQVVGVTRLAPRIARPCFSLRRAKVERRERSRRSVEQLLQAVDVLLLWRRAGVEQIEIAIVHERLRSFHERDAASLNRVGNDGLRAIGDRIERAERPLKGPQVMAATPADVPPERAKLRFDVAEIADLPHPRVRLDLVVVDDRDNLAELHVRRRAERLPELPFLQLAVAGEHEDAARRTRQPVRERHPLGLRDAHAERTGVRLDVRRLDVRVSRQPANPAKLMELVCRKQTESDQHRIERRGVVPFRGKEDVAVVRPLVEIAQLVQEEPRHDLERAEAGADVSRPGARDHVQGVDARERRKGGGLRHGIAPRGDDTGELRDRDVAKL